MDLEEARTFVGSHHRAVLATRSPGGGLQQSPVLVVVDAAGDLVVSSRETAFKVRNLRRDPWAQLCVLSDGFFGPWVWVQATADIVSLPEAMDRLVEYYRAANGEHPDWDAYRTAMREERRVAVRLTPDAAGPDRQG